MSRERAALAWLTLMLASAGGCEVELRGVPIVRGMPGDETDMDELPGDDDDEADVSPSDDGEDDSAEPPAISFYRYDFDQVDAELGEPWRAEPGAAQIWGKRLCIRPGASIELLLTPGRYGYVRLDAAAQIGLAVAARSTLGQLFELRWEETGVTLLGNVVPGGPSTVQSYAAAIDHDARRVEVRAGAEAAVSAAFAAEAGGELEALVFSQSATSRSMACIDNLYVAEKLPASDPFAMALPVNVCVPALGDAAGRCLSERCCMESIGTSVYECAADCINDHPSHSVADCNSVCALDKLLRSIANPVPACADQQCAGAAEEVATLPLEPAELPSSGTPAALDKRLELEALLTDDRGSSSELVEVDLRSGHREVLATVQHSQPPQDLDDDAEFHTEPTHSRAVLRLSRQLFLWQRGQPEMRPVQLPETIDGLVVSDTLQYAWVYTRARRSPEKFVYLLQNESVLLRLPVEDFFNVGFGPHDRYAYFELDGQVIVIDLLAGRQATFSIGTTDSWSNIVSMCFDDSIAWITCETREPADSWIWHDLSGASVDAPGPASPSCDAGNGYRTYGNGFLPAGPDMYWNGATAPLRINPVPADFNAWWRPLRAAGNRVLYRAHHEPNGDSWRDLVMADRNGATIASPPVEPWAAPELQASVDLHSALPFDIDRGLAVFSQSYAEGLTVRDERGDTVIGSTAYAAYEFDGAAFDFTRLDELPYYELEEPQFVTRPGSSLVLVETWHRGVLTTRVYDVVAKSPLTTLDPQMPTWLWAEYPSASLYSETDDGS